MNNNYLPKADIEGTDVQQRHSNNPRKPRAGLYETNSRCFVPKGGILNDKTRLPDKTQEVPWTAKAFEQQAISQPSLRNQPNNTIENRYTSNNLAHSAYAIDLSTSCRERDGRELQQSTGYEILDEDQGYLSDSGVYRGKPAKTSFDYASTRDAVEDSHEPVFINFEYMAALPQGLEDSNPGPEYTITRTYPELPRALPTPIGSEETRFTQPQNGIDSGLHTVPDCSYDQSSAAEGYPEVSVGGMNPGSASSSTNDHMVVNNTPSQPLPRQTIAKSNLKAGSKRKRNEAALDEPSKGTRKGYDYLKDVQAPSRDLGLGLGPHTLVEIITFLSRAHLNFPIANRFINNGLDYALHQFIVRRARSGDDVSEEANSILDADRQAYPTNTILKGYQITMREGPLPTHKLPGWKCSTHTKPANWDATYLNLDGYLPRCITHPSKNLKGPATRGRKEPEDIAMEDLLKGVRNIPSGADALDLTRAILYAHDNPGKFRYPQDLSKVVSLLGGPAPITADHYDAAAIARAKHRREQYKEAKRGAGKVARKRKKVKRGHKIQVTSTQELNLPIPSVREQQQVATQPTQSRQSHLLRDYVYPHASDRSDVARAVRFANMVESVDYTDDPETIAMIIRHMKAHSEYEDL
ncbi:hypothetical protein AOQ84DRAFT_404607 [Glonium stellatum]|uniref:Uncharacterized protein n=1 Tax=Glonium stellatum TaxID=574774 RepID=A0A8E2JU69_9PEZI|nr:hypothetical protein AOQ84DRAFT_404607 [Glonium stellatum]